ncbi:MAG: carbamoyl-phosphate synthase (glutamine-hydrolyzing) large subunit [Nanobdellota archaeon]
MGKAIKKILLLGSGALQIGQAGEFDYSGSQAIKAMKEEGVKTILINPNIATIQTSKELADKVYFYPVTPGFVEKIIKKEKPEGILLSFGGQTALNCGIELEKKGILEKYNVKVLGTQVSTINNTEDRDLFCNEMNKIGIDIPKSKAVKTTKQALTAAEDIGYPIILRSAFSLGGQGSKICHTKDDLEETASSALSRTKQILIEEYLGGFKEIEYEVMRDSHDNAITICNMENFDPMGIHTGESIVVAPSQTLSNDDYHFLREISIRIIRHIGVVGECNVQFAYNPDKKEYRVIELNPRLSRSSALASKATGYPIAFIAAKLGLGYALTELKNSITRTTTACFEPALDYIVTKIPRWDLNKFNKVSTTLGSEMKSVGEVMAIGRSFEESLQKAVRMLQVGLYGIVGNEIKLGDLKELISKPTDKRLFAISKAIKKGYKVENISKDSGIDKWFLYKIKNIVEIQERLKNIKQLKYIDKETLVQAKKAGFSDKQISVIFNCTEKEISKTRHLKGIFPKVKQIDTLAAEFPAKTNYLYLTYHATEDDIAAEKDRPVMVLGGGAYRIGSSVEFDWCCVSCAETLKKEGYKTIMINYNPETVSTDYDIYDKLYFDELSVETITEIYKKENSQGAIISMGGQIPNNLALKLDENNVKILGTNPKDIDRAESRHKFSKILDKIGIDQPQWKELKTISEAKRFAKKVDYPVLIRPSYVLSGSAMNVAYNESELENYLNLASHVSKEHPVVISKFFINTKEIEMDAVAKKGEIISYAISEHIENAGVHSGDATLVLPPQKTYLETIRKVKKRTRQIAKELKINGPLNIQFLAKDNMLKVIECNLRASRSFPFASKIMGCNLIEIATKAIMQKEFSAPKLSLDKDYVGVKAPQFSYARLKGADPVLDVEMTSTGEVGCIGNSLAEALLLSMISTGYRIPEKGVLLSIGGEKNKYNMLKTARRINDLGLKIFATTNTSKFLDKYGINNELVENTLKNQQVKRIITEKEVDFVINIPSIENREDTTPGYILRRLCIDYNCPLITNVQLAKSFVKSFCTKNPKNIMPKSWDEFIEDTKNY